MTLVILALAWLLGFSVAGLWSAPLWLAGGWFLAAVPAALLIRGRGAALLLAGAALLAVAGAWRFEGWADEELPDLARSVGAEVTIEGRIDSEPDPGLTTLRYHVRAERVAERGTTRKTDGRVLVTLGQFADFDTGTPVRVSGTLEAASVLDAFDYRAFLARRGVVGTMLFPRVVVTGERDRWTAPAITADVRLSLEQGLQASLPEPEASLAAGIVMGRDANMPPELTEAFRETGLAHFVAVSGSNIALVTAVAFLLFTPLVGRNWATLPAAASLTMYVFVAGGDETVVRSAIMAAILLLGYWLGRPQSGLAALGAAALLMTAIDPGVAAEVGFQLSVAATAGLIVFAPWIRYGLGWAIARAGMTGLVPSAFVDVAALSLAAWVGTLPLIWVTFGRISLVGPLLNIPTVPLFAVAFWLSGVAAVAGAVWEPAGWALGIVAYYPLAFIIWIAEAGASLPGAAVDVPGRGAPAALGAYVLLAVAAWPAYRYLVPTAAPPRPPRAPALVSGVRRVALAAVACALLATVFAVSLAPLNGPGRLEVTVLDVGQGDAILVTTPGGKRVVVDGGPSGIALARELGAVLPHWEREVAAVVLTHPQADHVGGLPTLLERFDVGTVYDNGATHDTMIYASFVEGARTRTALRRGDSFEIDNVRFEVLWPLPGELDSDLNEASLVLRLHYQGATVLLTGDIEAGAQQALVDLGDIEADVIKVPHHGADTNAAGFWSAASTRLAVISAGAGNRFGHPSDETLAALAGQTVLRTDLHGRVTIASDGAAIRVRVER